MDLIIFTDDILNGKLQAALLPYHTTLEKSIIVKTFLKKTGFFVKEGNIYLRFLHKINLAETEITRILFKLLTI